MNTNNGAYERHGRWTHEFAPTQKRNIGKTVKKGKTCVKKRRHISSFWHHYYER